jgi:hypothetical protein
MTIAKKVGETFLFNFVLIIPISNHLLTHFNIAECSKCSSLNQIDQTVFYQTVLYQTVLYQTVLYQTVLYQTVLYQTVNLSNF